MSASSRLHGVVPMLVTPFNADGQIDKRGLRHIVNHVLTSGAHGVAALGLAAEAHTLSGTERREITELIVESLGGRAPLLVTASAESTRLAIDFARHAERSGAAAIMLAPPQTTRAQPTALARHFGAVAAAVTVPIMIQDAPGYIGTSLGPGFITDMVRAHPNILYVKTEAMPAGEAISQIRDAVGDAVSIFSGTGGLYLLDTLRAGAAGTIPGSDVSDYLVPVFECYQDGRIAEARTLFQEILPLLVYQMQSLEVCVATTKAVLVHRGVIACKDLRAPGLEISDRTCAEVTELFDELTRTRPQAR